MMILFVVCFKERKSKHMNGYLLIVMCFKVPACVQLFVGDPVTMLRKNPSSARQVAAVCMMNLHFPFNFQIT